MNTSLQEFEALVRSAIAAVAPEVDAAEIPSESDFRVDADLDSMDFLAVLEHVRTTTGVTVPELDYPSIRSIGGFAAYLAATDQAG